jgi:hypothetical protein
MVGSVFQSFLAMFCFKQFGRQTPFGIPWQPSLNCISFLLLSFVLTEVWRFAEMFAGEANVTHSLRNSSFPGICCDINLGGRAMNLLTPSGMAFLCCNYKTVFHVMVFDTIIGM